MIRRLLKSKIHRATVTEADLNYDGSVTIDEQLIRAANLVEFEQVDVLDITNGNRLTTYVIKGEPGSGIICLNGAAARLVQVDDLVIIVSYADYDEAEIAEHQPVVVLVDADNKPRA
jgi:aspartate 1-decarboxylase|tara:strand:+ start:361 stop:711 length:351 start_codon:yes stop_codon:yes gene_type:complete